MAKVMKPDALEKAIQMSLLYGKSADDIGKELGVTPTAIRRNVDIFKLVQAQDWDTLEYKILVYHYGEPVVKWASEKLGVEVPEKIWWAFVRNANERYEKKTKELPAQEQTEKEQTVLPLDEPKNDNDAVYFIRILEELTKTNELLTQLMDVVVPKYVSDIKDSIGVNADIIRADVGEVVKNTECIKNNTRKRGL